jgi:hypothetical protein
LNNTHEDSKVLYKTSQIMGKGRRQNSQGKSGITSNGAASTRGEEHDGHQIHDYIYTQIHVYTRMHDNTWKIHNDT